MLNLIDPVQYTGDEIVHLNGVLKPKLSNGWKDKKNKTKTLKYHINTHAFIAQGGRCAYCESPLLKGALAIDHIAPKGLYGEFCFEPYNLVMACTSCNSPNNKGETDTIKRPVNHWEYSANSFKIVHPFFDNPTNHFKYLDSDNTIFDLVNCSQEALETINMMHWNDSWAYNQRVRTSRTRNMPIDVLKLVGEIVTHK